MLSHGGSQSAPQPISLPWLPGTDTASGWVIGPRSMPASAGGCGCPTIALVETTPKSPSWSRAMARYSTGVPWASPLTSWNTRYGALSSVPSLRHVVSPTGRHAKVTWVKSPPGTVTPTSARPVTMPASPGAVNDGIGRSRSPRSFEFAL